MAYRTPAALSVRPKRRALLGPRVALRVCLALLAACVGVGAPFALFLAAPDTIPRWLMAAAVTVLALAACAGSVWLTRHLARGQIVLCGHDLTWRTPDGAGRLRLDEPFTLDCREQSTTWDHGEGQGAAVVWRLAQGDQCLAFWVPELGTPTKLALSEAGRDVLAVFGGEAHEVLAAIRARHEPPAPHDDEPGRSPPSPREPPLERQW